MSKEAQAFFDQGLSLVYAFNFRDAALSFRQASEFAPNAPMPYWGLALALGPNYNYAWPSPESEMRGFRAIQDARLRECYGSVKERQLISALAVRFTDDPNSDLANLASSYVAKMAKLYSTYPDDPDLGTLYAEGLLDLDPHPVWSQEGKPQDHTLEAVSVLESVLKHSPTHLGANHLYVHAMEASPFPEKALETADRLRNLAPAFGHLLHMPSHIYFKLGDYEKAERSNVDAIKADQEYFATRSGSNSNYFLGYAAHNYLSLISAADMVGDFDVAYRASIELQTKVLPLVDNWPEAASYVIAPLEVLLRFGRWNQILQTSSPAPKSKAAVFYWRYSRACSYAALAKFKKANTERQEMDNIVAGVDIDAPFGIYRNSWALIYKLADETLGARIATATRNFGSAIAQLEDAIIVQDEMRYDEPPEWYASMRGTLGATYLRAGQPARAERVFKQDLARIPKNPWTLFGLWKSQSAQGRVLEANSTRITFTQIWKGTTQPALDDY